MGEKSTHLFLVLSLTGRDKPWCNVKKWGDCRCPPPSLASQAYGDLLT